MVGVGKHFTRGSGVLEDFLARQRAQRAEILIPQELRQGRVLDIGCGTVPYFLLQTRFREKYGIDPAAGGFSGNEGIIIHPGPVKAEAQLPFADSFFSVIVSLGTLEHFDEEVWHSLLKEVCRLLCPGGRLILTAPAVGTYGLLEMLARFGLVSPQEVRDARHFRSTGAVQAALVRAGLRRDQLTCGKFQLGMNRWFCAVR